MKKLISIILALTLVLSLSVTAFAADDGSITINGVSDGTKYAIYRLMDLESFEKDAAYSYKVNADWTDFFTTGFGKDYVSIDESGYVTWVGAEDETTKATFAQKALAYAKSEHIDPVKSSENPGDFVISGTSGTFANLPLGWYLVDSTAGALCGLTTTDKNAEINAKNGVPTIDKQVQEDLTGLWGDHNTADIGQIVNFMTIIHVANGAEKYVLHDKMSEHLTFKHDLSSADKAEWRGVTEIKHITSGGVETILQEGVDKDYTVKTTGLADDCTFEVAFSDALNAKLKANERIIIYYNAMLNRLAETGKDGEKNPNESWLEYGEEHFTTHDKTDTYTFQIDIVKTTSSNKLLDGAEFKIYDAAVGGNEIAVVPLMEADDTTPVLDTNGNPMYRHARADETGVAIKVVGGKVTVVGFDNGVYYLEETKAPDGYNKLAARQEFTVADGNLDSVFNDGVYSTGSGVHVVNKTGSMLPETGAQGTFLFITLGMFTVLATGVLLVTKKRMSMIQE